MLRERGLDWVSEQIEKEYADILANGGIAAPELVPEGFGGYQSNPQPLGQGALLPVVHSNGTGHAEYDRWLDTNVREQRQAGYAMVTVRVDQGNLTGDQMRGIARIASDAGDGLVRVIDRSESAPGLHSAGPRCRGVYAALGDLGLAGSGAREIEDVTTCPGAYSCNLALTKSMNLGAALQEAVAALRRPARAQAHASRSAVAPIPAGSTGSPISVFTATRARSMAKRFRTTRCCWAAVTTRDGIMRFGLAVQSVPARLAPAAVKRILDHYIANRAEGETFREYVMRHKVEILPRGDQRSRQARRIAPEMYQDWGDDDRLLAQARPRRVRRVELPKSHSAVAETWHLTPGTCLSYPINPWLKFNAC